MTHRRVQIFGIVLICLLIAGSASADVDVQRLTMARHGLFTALTVHAPGRLLSNHFIEEPKDGRPFRVVLDLCGAVHQLGQKNFNDLPSDVVTRIRTSQYATSPENIVRVVLDLKQEVTYKVATEPESIVISLVAPGEPAFEPWSSFTDATAPVMAQSQPVKQAPPSAINVPETVRETKELRGFVDSRAPYEEAASPRSVMARTPERSEPAPSEPSPKPAVVSVEPPKESPAKAWETNNSEQKTAQPEPEWAAAPKIEIAQPAEPEPRAVVVEAPPKPEVVEADVLLAEESPPKYAAVVQYYAPIGPEWKPEPAPEPEIAETPLLSEAESMPVTEGETGEELTAVTEETPLAEESPEPAAEVVEAEEQMPLLARLKSKFFGGPDEEHVVNDAVAESSALERIKALAAVTDGPASAEVSDTQEEGQTAPTGTGVDASELESKIATVETPTAATAPLYAATDNGVADGEENQNTGWKGRRVRTDATRRLISYERIGRRDPFDPLIEGQRSGLWTTALPRVDALRLVGILEDFDGVVALFEDMEGYGYILHEGDPVKNGYVKAIGENRVLFHIDDYGWVHTVVLQLRRDSSDPTPGMATEFDEGE